MAAQSGTLICLEAKSLFPHEVCLQNIARQVRHERKGGEGSAGEGGYHKVTLHEAYPT